MKSATLNAWIFAAQWHRIRKHQRATSATQNRNGTYPRTNCCRLGYIAQRERIIFASALETAVPAPNHLSCIQRGQQRVGVNFVTSISTASETRRGSTYVAQCRSRKRCKWNFPQRIQSEISVSKKENELRMWSTEIKDARAHRLGKSSQPDNVAIISRKTDLVRRPVLTENRICHV